MEITGFWFFFLIVIVFPTVFEFVIGVIQIEPGGVETEIPALQNSDCGTFYVNDCYFPVPTPYLTSIAKPAE